MNENGNGNGNGIDEPAIQGPSKDIAPGQIVKITTEEGYSWFSSIIGLGPMVLVLGPPLKQDHPDIVLAKGMPKIIKQ